LPTRSSAVDLSERWYLSWLIPWLVGLPVYSLVSISGAVSLE
jgi:hypothetical protein